MRVSFKYQKMSDSIVDVVSHDAKSFHNNNLLNLNLNTAVGGE